jgi:RimJ/RimL family protein N-acetyltransferase
VDVILRTERLSLRKLAMADVDDLLLLFGDPESTRYLHGIKTRPEVEEWVGRSLARYEQDGLGLWAVVPNGADRLVGYCGLIPQADVDGRDEIEIGYGLLPASRGQGYATEAACGCRDLAFDTRGLKRVISLIAPKNLPSRRVAERVGMQVEKEVERWNLQILVYALETTSRP